MMRVVVRIKRQKPVKIFVVASIILISATLSTPLLAADQENVWMKTDRISIGAGVFFIGFQLN